MIGFIHGPFSVQEDIVNEQDDLAPVVEPEERSEEAEYRFVLLADCGLVQLEPLQPRDGRVPDVSHKSAEESIHAGDVRLAEAA